MFQARVLQEQLVLIRYAEFRASRVLGLRWHTLYLTEADHGYFQLSRGTKKNSSKESMKENDLKFETVRFCSRDSVVSL